MSRAWTWRHGVAESDLQPMTKLVLHTLGLHMSAAGENCFPSIVRICSESGLSSKTTVIKHLKFAEVAGWIRIERCDQRPGKKNKANRYHPTFPAPDSDGGDGAVSGSPDGPLNGSSGTANEPLSGPSDDNLAVHQMDRNISKNIPTPSSADPREGEGSDGEIDQEDGDRRELFKQFRKDYPETDSWKIWAHVEEDIWPDLEFEICEAIVKSLPAYRSWANKGGRNKPCNPKTYIDQKRFKDHAAEAERPKHQDLTFVGEDEPIWPLLAARYCRVNKKPSCPKFLRGGTGLAFENGWIMQAKAELAKQEAAPDPDPAADDYDPFEDRGGPESRHEPP